MNSRKWCDATQYKASPLRRRIRPALCAAAQSLRRDPDSGAGEPAGVGAHRRPTGRIGPSPALRPRRLRPELSLDQCAGGAMKLLFIDFANAGTISWTVSLIGVSLLVLAAGYFAPAPP